jgi:CRP-like cAMP-binding protein
MRVAPIFPHIQEALLRESRPRMEPEGIVLFRRDEPAFGIFLVRSGSISLRLDGAGTDAIMDLKAGPGSIVGLPATLAGSRYSLTAVTLEPCHLAFIEREKLMATLREDTEVCMELLGALGEEVISMREVLCAPPAL